MRLFYYFCGLTLLTILLALACSDEGANRNPGGSASDGGADGTSDGDADGDADGDVDADADTDADADPPRNCSTDPNLATPEHGARLLACAVEALVARLDDWEATPL